MQYRYDISFNGIHYQPIDMIDGDARVVWEKADSGIVYKKRLDGSFILNRAKNENLYDAIIAITFCDLFLITVLNKYNDEIVTSQFGRLNIEFNSDLCKITIKPIFYDPRYDCISSNGDKDVNIYSYFQPSIINYTFSKGFEFITCYDTNIALGNAYWDGNEWQEVNSYSNAGFPRITSNDCADVHPLWEIRNINTGWTFYSQKDTNLTGNNSTGWYADIQTTWFREVRLQPNLHPNGLDVLPVSPPKGTSNYDWINIGGVRVNGIDYYKWVRCVDNLVLQSTNQILPTSENYITWSLSSYYEAPSNRVISRAIKLNDVLAFFAQSCDLTFKSEFFTNSDNPISHKDLSNLFIVPKSDCLFSGSPPVEPSDPATRANITFNQLMSNLKAMFQVDWYISTNDEFVVEHIKYFRQNLSYTGNTAIGINLKVVYPLCLDGSNVYSYDAQLPLLEKFNFNEAWNIDFIGVDIDYSDCLATGNTDTFSADLITTDLDPEYLDNSASDDTFCMFQCDSNGNVLDEIGILSQLLIPNAHLSWANLQDAYWKINRPLGNALMNNVMTNFILDKKLKNQNEIQFPFCMDNFDPNLLITTDMGDGEVKAAEYSFKTGNIKVQLIYE
jgi:hypothetical protein